MRPSSYGLSLGRRAKKPEIANPATDRQRRYIGHLLDERSIANPPDPNDPRLSKEAASELLDELLNIPTRRGEFDRNGDSEVARWWRELPLQARIAWILDKRRDELMQRTDIYYAVRDDETPGTIHAQNKRISEALEEMLKANHVRMGRESYGYHLTPAGERIVPTPPGARRR